MAGNDDEVDYYKSLEIKPYIGAIILVLTSFFFGIVGNVHVLFVYTFRMKATSHRIFIIALAVLDLMSCTVGMPFAAADMFHRYAFNAQIACRILRFFMYFVGGSLQDFFFYLLQLIGYFLIFRYLKTCRPFGEQINPYRAKLLCAVVLIFCVLSFWPIPVLYGHSTKKMPNTNITGVTCYIDDAFKDTYYLAYWNGKGKGKMGNEELKKFTVNSETVKTNLGSGETCLNTEIESHGIMSGKESSATNIETGVALNISNIDVDVHVEKNKYEKTYNNSSEQTTDNRENSRKQREALRNLMRSKRTTKIFFTITVLYFVTFIPHLILQVIALTQNNFVARLSLAGQTIYHILTYSSFLSSMVNSYVYGFFDTMFRDEKHTYSNVNNMCYLLT
ncbi:uncharacterized protein LOC128557952 [Mercenaria mercenaria]|uniref:uncharacterized protein LOC128557952 n=1 Tax=Mercenaria mercenaria TaxID=6596 RepID=UPI00234F81E6|nr:uncharacterized protein LOC128557952 [Mercenaria mercenaria]